MKRLRVLVTCRTLARRSGSEAYARDLALGLLRRGHQPIVYCPDPGPAAEDLLAASIAVVSDLSALGEPPDIIHANHHPEGLTALLRFVETPAVHVCHAWHADEANPLRFPRVLRYIAVDDTCRERLIDREGIDPQRISVQRNAVDLARFRPRAALPARPARALVFSNSVAEHAYADVVRAACAEAGIELDVAGGHRSVAAPETQLPRYDLVFAKARCALEAAAVGCAVVLCDWAGGGPLLTAENAAALWERNFGIRALRDEVTIDHLRHEIRRFDSQDAARVRDWVRQHAALDGAIDGLLELYEQVLAEHAAAPEPDRVAELEAAAAYLQAEVPKWSAVADLRRDYEESCQTREGLRRAATEQREAAERMADTRTWRWREAALRHPAIRWLRRI